MSDDIHPSDTPSAQDLALNAALDGTATADERALIDASPELTQSLADLERARRTAAHVDVPTDARESGIRAALAAFDDLHDVAAPSVAASAGRSAGPSNVIAFERRRRWYRAVTGAAAAVLLVVGAIALATSTGGEDQDNAATVDPSSQKSAEDAGRATDEAPTDAMTPMADTASEAPPADAADRTADQVETAAASESTTNAEAPAPAETVPPSTIGSIGGSAEVTPDIPDEDALRQYAATAAVDGDAAPTDDCAPGAATRLGAIVYQGTPAIVVRDDAGKVLAYASDDCTLLATIPA